MKLLEDGESKIDILGNVLYRDDYNALIGMVKDKQIEVSLIDSAPILNYTSSLIEDKDYDLLVYLYKNVKYYMEQKEMYGTKLQEGLAVVISKSAILFYRNFAHLDNYFKRGDSSLKRGTCNPFEEMGRLLLNATINSYWDKQQGSKSILELSNARLNFNTKSQIMAVANAMNEIRLRKKIKGYYNVDFITELTSRLDISEITSSSPISATLQENRELILEQIDKIITLNTNKVYYEKLFNGVMPNDAYNKLLKDFDNQVIYAKRNIGVYEKTKQLSKNI